jgi:hypothetical protein
MFFDYKTILGALAVLMTIWAHIPYLLHTLKGTNKPHVFTWVIWTLLTGIAFAAQVVGKAGPGAWATGFTSAICLVITIAAYRVGEKHITRSDWAMFLFGLASIPIWMMTSDPIWSIWIVTIIDVSAVYPTFRKSWLRPHEENSFMYGFNIPRHVITILAITNLSLTTWLYPAGLLVMNLVMFVMLKTRRSNLAGKQHIVNPITGEQG